MKTSIVRHRQGQRQRETGLEFLASNCALLVVVLFIFGFAFENFVIPSSSMASTLLVGDHIMVDRLSVSPPSSWAPFLPYREVHRGDIVVFFKPTEEANGEHLPLVKRVIGIPGDRIRLRAGIVYLNGRAQNEPQATKPPYTSPDMPYDAYRDDFPAVSPSEGLGVTAQWSLELPTRVSGEDLVVPAESYFVMGDNRAISLDSRYWGFVPRSNVLGRPLFVYWSFPTPDGLLDNPALTAEQARFTLHEIVHFFDETRWRRTFRILN